MPGKTTTQAFKEIPDPPRDSLNSSVDRYRDIGSRGGPNSKRLTAFGEGNEYETKGGYKINASKIVKLPMTQFTQKFSIIATQAPILEEEGRAPTLDAFWDLAFKSKADAIVTLGPVEKDKLYDYWSKGHMSGVYYTTVKNVGSVYTAEHRKIKIRNLKNNSTKEIDHYHYINWKDRDVPDNFNYFEGFVLNFMGNRKLIVHCSAGVGRTGAFSACLSILRSFITNPQQLVRSMRSYRAHMVQTPSQFDMICKFAIRNGLDPFDLISRNLNPKPAYGDAYKIDYDDYFPDLN